MWGALTFLLMFLVIDPTTRDILRSTLEQARLRLALEAPLPYFMLVVLVGSALISALIMIYWPRTEEKQEPTHLVRRYHGPAASELDRGPRTKAFGFHQFVELAAVLLTLRVRTGIAKFLRRRCAGAPINSQNPF